jgi:hypothetical protein
MQAVVWSAGLKDAVKFVKKTSKAANTEITMKEQNTLVMLSKKDGGEIARPRPEYLIKNKNGCISAFALTCNLFLRSFIGIRFCKTFSRSREEEKCIVTKGHCAEYAAI